MESKSYSGMGRFFSDDYVVENKVVNLFGGQVVRYILAKVVYAFRGIIFSWNKNELNDELKKNGIVTIKDFLSPSDYKLLLDEFEALKNIGVHEPIVDGDTTCDRYTLDKSNVEQFSILNNKIILSPELVEILEYAERRTFATPKIWCDSVINGDQAVGEDSQKVLHTDNFFLTHKVWFFLDDVTIDDGPLCVVPKTHKFNFKRVVFEYINSLNYDKVEQVAWRVVGKWNSFMRPVLVSSIVKGNTIVIANTHAYHRRGDALPGKTRRQIHYRIRSAPFTNILDRSGTTSTH